MTAAVLLAAGGSRRLGRAKQLVEVEVEGASLLRRAARSAIDGGCRPVVVVLGAEVEQMRTEVEDLPLELAINPAWREGLASSIRRGMAALDDRGDACDLDAVLLLGCDQPALDAAVVRRLLEAHRGRGDSPAGIAACQYADTLGTPAVFGRGLFGRLRQLRGDRGAKALLLAAAAGVVRVPWPEGARDVDRPGDLPPWPDTGDEL